MPGVTGSFVVADYVVFAMLLVLSAAIGVYTGWTARGQGGAGHFLTGSRKLTALPVSASLITTFMSSVTLLTNPVEVYQYGAIFGLLSISYIVAIVVSSEIFLPFFYRLNITSVYEYLELRFNRTIRLLGTLLFIAQAILLNGLIIYAPALALNQGAGTDLWGVIISTAVVCTLYCTVGGMKAVVWTCVLQIGVMLAGNLSVIIKAVMLQGGVGTIWSDAQQGGRINLWDFDPNPQRRNTFWTLTIGGAFGWTTTYGTNQAQVQTYISCKSVTHARVALYINLLGLMAVLLSSVFAGLCLYSVYKSCDPHTAGLVSASDQLMPYLVMDILTGYPGLPGLYFAAVYSGTLSTVSCTINSLAAVTLEDLIKPFTSLSAKQLSILSKGLSFVYGVLFVAMAGLASFMGGLMQASVIVSGVTQGSMFGVFTLGILCPFANSKGCLSGLVSGVMASVCVILGALVSTPTPEMTRPLPLTTEGCNFTTSLNSTFTALPTQLAPFTTAIHRGLDGWHSISYLYYGVIGTLVALIVGIIVSLLTGGHREKVDPTLTLKREDTLSYHLFKFLKEKCIES
ncbi:sodium-coupled monocarboxylate transporter 1-like [Stegastes partitus]|uniref:Sodium-coupled monocarboxylate transporter 1-like n=1 Tax=Stegastes partitus TaxID=144197 RepID=A0A9Y4MUS2_9TELE|nr:PREDICTED: sodium-coupled monocarboxylate transporter 1-like [Stegastes partitus]